MSKISSKNQERENPSRLRSNSKSINSFIIGMGSIFDISGSYFNENKYLDKSLNDDFIEHNNDWDLVASDFNRVLNKIVNKYE